MKKFLIFTCLTMTCSLSFAQLKIGSDGKVAIGTDATPLSTMSVNSAGEVTIGYAYASSAINSGRGFGLIGIDGAVIDSKYMVLE